MPKNFLPLMNYRRTEGEQSVENCYKLQTDATWSLEERFRNDSKNEERSGFGVHFLNVSSPLVAEILALKEAIYKCKDFGIQRLSCETDSTLLVQSIKLRKPTLEIYGVVSDIFSLMIPCFTVIRFKWILRGKNKEADVMVLI